MIPMEIGRRREPARPTAHRLHASAPISIAISKLDPETVVGRDLLRAHNLSVVVKPRECT